MGLRTNAKRISVPDSEAQRRSMVVPSRHTPASALDADKLRYRLLSPASRDDGERADLATAYATWRRVWGDTLRDLDGAERVFSDDFTRQHEHGVLFHAGECVGMTAFRWVDFRETSALEDSYFKPWPASARTALLGEGRRVCIGSYLTVDSAWRGARGPISVKELLLALAVERFLASDADVMAGTLRNDRGMNSLGYRLGARAIAENLPHHGVDVDLVMFDRQSRDRFHLTPLVEDVTGTLLVRALEEKLP